MEARQEVREAAAAEGLNLEPAMDAAAQPRLCHRAAAMPLLCRRHTTAGGGDKGEGLLPRRAHLACSHVHAMDGGGRGGGRSKERVWRLRRAEVTSGRRRAWERDSDGRGGEREGRRGGDRRGRR